MLLRITSPLLGPNVLTALRLCLATVTLAIIMRGLALPLALAALA